VQEIIAIVRQVASGLLPEQPDPLDDGLPGGCARALAILRRNTPWWAKARLEGQADRKYFLR